MHVMASNVMQSWPVTKLTIRDSHLKNLGNHREAKIDTLGYVLKVQNRIEDGESKYSSNVLVMTPHHLSELQMYHETVFRNGLEHYIIIVQGDFPRMNSSWYFEIREFQRTYSAYLNKNRSM